MNEKEILDEFDKLFIIPAMINTKRPASTIYGGAVNYQLKAFISKALSEQRREIEKECNNLIDKCIGENDENYSYIYQKAVEDVIKIIQGK